MTKRSIVVITTFENDPWKQFLEGLKNKSIESLHHNSKSKEIEAKTTTSNYGNQLALKFEITSNETVVLAMQQDSEEDNKKLVRKIIDKWLAKNKYIAICAHGSGGTLSTSDQFYRYKTFHHCDQVCKNLKELFNNLTNGNSFDNFWNFIKSQTDDVANLLRFEILCPLVALDIDMQALEILAKKKENGVKIKVPKKYLEEMYADNIDYVKKLKELQEKVNTIGEIEGINKERLKKLVGISNQKVSQFFKKLNDNKDDPVKFFDHSWGIDGVNSFHDWYCALSSCLRGAEACEGKQEGGTHLRE